MSTCSLDGITSLLHAWRDGDECALENLVPLVYKELYRIAKRYMAREKPGHILQNTALVNETYLQLARLRGTEWQDRGHFFAVCSQLMRHILADYARLRLCQKGGGDVVQVPLRDHELSSHNAQEDLVVIDDALRRLAQVDMRKSQVVELRAFGGLSIEATARILNVSDGTVKRDWKLAQLWLLRELDRRERNGK